MSKSKVAGRVVTLFLAIVLPVFAAGQKNLPVLKSISPTSTTAGTVVTLITTGSNFSTGSMILWNGVALTTTYVSSTQLKTTLTSTQVTAAGTDKVYVYTAGRYGGTSAYLVFTINPAPTSTTTSSSSSSTTSTPLAITTTSIPIGTTGTAYSATLAASGGTAPYSWSVSGGALPPGLALSAAGAISGTPTTSGTYSFMASVKDTASNTLSYTFSTNIVQGTPPLAITTTSIPAGTAGTAYPSTTLAATGGTTPYTWTVSAGALPPGLTLASTTGAISGTPTAAASYSFSVQAKDAASNAVTHGYAITVAASTTTTSVTSLAVGTASVPNGTAGTAYPTTTLVASGGTSPYTWSVSSGALPAGLTLSSGGAISGTPTTAGSSSFTALVKDSATGSTTKTYSVTIGGVVSVTTTSIPAGLAGTAYPGTTLAATGGTSPYTWSVSSGTLPAGLTLSPAGAISGTPTKATSYYFTIKAQDAASNTITKSFSMAIAPPVVASPLPATACLNSTYGDCGDPYEGATFTTTGKTAISACGVSFVKGTSYYLTGPIGTNLGANCLTLSNVPGVTLDLRGFMITGQVAANSDQSGITVFNGIIQCSLAEVSGANGCLDLTADRPLTVNARIHHLLVDNTIDPGTYPVTSIYVGTPLGTTAAGQYGFQIDHVAIAVESAPSTQRSVAITAPLDAYFQMDYNYITCTLNTSSCQGVELINASGHSPVTAIHDNYFDMEQSPTVFTTNDSPGRAVALQGPDNGTIGPSFGSAVYSNYCIANANRCWRVRQVAQVDIHDNTIMNCTGASGLGCYSLADAHGIAPPYVNPTVITVENETIQMNGGIAFFVRNGNGVKIQNINITGTLGKLGRFDYLTANGVPEYVTVCAIPGAATLSTPSTTYTDSTPATNVVNNFGSGTIAPNPATTINILASCP